jgi:hypothetical protein
LEVFQPAGDCCFPVHNDVKRVGMKQTLSMRNGFRVTVCGAFIPYRLDGGGNAQTASPLIGQPITNFSLSSSQNRLVNYGPDYYGKYNLIITFFPAAFTPV